MEEREREERERGKRKREERERGKRKREEREREERKRGKRKLEERRKERRKSRKVVESSSMEGSLLANRLPSDAWEKWCKEGVVCFCMQAMDLLKVYFANPRDLSVYHVVDFVFGDYNRDPILNFVGCVMLGSKIYMIGGRGDIGFEDPTDVYYCDVATQTQLRHGGYQWRRGPDLKRCKLKPFVFSLAGNIYVLSFDYPHTSFEVLKSNSSSWAVLDPPPSILWTRDHGGIIEIRGSYTMDGKKIVLQVSDFSLCMMP